MSWADVTEKLIDRLGFSKLGGTAAAFGVGAWVVAHLLPDAFGTWATGTVKDVATTVGLVGVALLLVAGIGELVAVLKTSKDQSRKKEQRREQVDEVVRNIHQTLDVDALNALRKLVRHDLQHVPPKSSVATQLRNIGAVDHEKSRPNGHVWIADDIWDRLKGDPQLLDKRPLS